MGLGLERCFDFVDGRGVVVMVDNQNFGWIAMRVPRKGELEFAYVSNH